jgi:tetratricopeptide (TPR) repeat protein
MAETWEELTSKADQASEKGDFIGAQASRKAALALAENFEKKDPRLVISLHKLAESDHRLGQDDEAEKLLNRVVEIISVTYGPYHQKLAESANHLASLYYENGRFAEAEPLCRKILSIYQKTLGRKHMEVGKVAHNLAMILQELDKLEEAETYYRRALDIFKEKAGPFDSDLISLMENYANLLRATGNDDEADHLQACAMGRVSGSLRAVTRSKNTTVTPAK